MASVAKQVRTPVVDDDDEDALDEMIDDIGEDEATPPPSKKKKVPVLVEDDEDDDDSDVEDEEEEEAKPVPVAARRPMPVAKPAAPVIVSPPPGEEDVSDAEFDAEAKKRKSQQTVNDFLERKKSEETLSVEEMTELMMTGDTDKILHQLYPYCNDNSGIKRAKQLLREARDRAKARVVRIAGVVGVMLDELRSEDENSGGE